MYLILLNNTFTIVTFVLYAIIPLDYGLVQLTLNLSQYTTFWI